MITAYDTQTIGNHLIQQLVQQETEKRMAAFYRDRAAEMAAKDAEIARLKGLLEIREARAAKNYRRMAMTAKTQYKVKRESTFHRALLIVCGILVETISRLESRYSEVTSRG